MKERAESSDIKDRLLGCFIGTAVGDALGIPNEFSEAKAAKAVEANDPYPGGGPFDYPAGAYSDDTSLMLCLATSLLERQGYDSMDVMYTYAKYMNEGYLSSVGYCADIGIGTMQAIDAFLENSSATYGSDRLRSNSAGNGCITRLAPVVLAAYARRTREEIIEMARISVLDTHDNREAEAVAMILADMTWKALLGKDKDEIVRRQDNNPNPLYAAIYDELTKMVVDEIAPFESIGRAKASLAIAVWAFYYGGYHFLDGATWCVEIGGDTDSQAATYGILAGAYYGLSGIPDTWLKRLHNFECLKTTAELLIEMDKCPILYTRFEEDLK
jgi:ADP-ribosyl-[dinitrogen reductase] hydrolase